MTDPRDPSQGPQDTDYGAPGSADAYARGAAGGPQDEGAAGGDDLDDSPASASADAASIGANDLEVQQHKERYLRLAAEYDNYRKRTARERQETHSRAQADLARQLVEPLDDLARFAHVDPATVDAATVVEGAAMVERKLFKALSAVGLQVINPVDQTFDPALHEAVGTEPTTSREDDHVVARVYQPGYVFNGQLLRPARVVVKQYHG